MINIVVPYLGNLSRFNLYSARQLHAASQNNSSVNLVFIFDRSYDVDFPYLRLEEALLDNEYGVVIEFLLDNPYKLCDLRPIFHKIFKMPSCDYLGWADLDCLYSEDIFMSLDSGSGKGGYGHLTFLKLSDINDFLCHIPKEYFSSRKNFAIDEHRFLHKYLEKAGIYMKAFDLIDFDPRYNQAKDYSGRNVRMVRKIGGVYYESCVGTFSFRRIDYLHFQKRSVYDFDSDLIVSNGVYMISKPDRYRFIKFYFNRLKYHFKNGTLIRR